MMDRFWTIEAHVFKYILNLYIDTPPPTHTHKNFRFRTNICFSTRFPEMYNFLISYVEADHLIYLQKYKYWVIMVQ